VTLTECYFERAEGYFKGRQRDENVGQRFNGLVTRV
jgi:hypothetical protein